MNDSQVLQSVLKKVKNMVGSVPVFLGNIVPDMPVAVVCQYDITSDGTVSVRYRKFRHGFSVHRGLIKHQVK